MAEILSEVSKTSIQLILKEPFYGHFFTGMLKEVTEQIPTAAVSLVNKQMVKLLVNPNFWKELSDTEKRYGLIKHELLHIVLKHLFSMKEFSNKRLYNIAADIVVNQYISKHQLPEGGITLERFWYLEEKYQITLERDKDAGYYYHLLKKILDGNSPVKKDLSVNDENGKGKPDPITEDDLSKTDLEELWRHETWKEVEELTEAEQKVLNRSINEIIVQTVDRIKHKDKGIGNLPAGLQQYLDALLESLKPNVNWRRVLRLFSATSNRTFLKNTIQRPSKRYGVTPGIKVKRKQKMLIAIDTSGSVSIPELQEFFGEIYHIWRQGAEIYVVECDAAIRNHYPYRGKPPEIVSGRGGTHFNAPVVFANEKYRPDAIVYFTDGFAAAPTVKSRCPILWMISQNGIEENKWEFLPGRKVKMQQ
ncbi:vWA domain-containing protein [Chondrinema litorale]|uniref:vWA domain-containing protein n=1 Tax=Chondrinema litorale TaxID=2994555 RepID=UPI00254333CC|nr:VWA-like domain-containing protein [Chondrinema litorale]UZR96891.1 VWA-like domain-containing protein [Chondrinema litorale]